MAGAPLGNQNGAKGKDWRDAIRRATARIGEADYRRGLDKLADQFVAAVGMGDIAAFREYGDRIDGKVPQAIVGDDESDPIRTVSEVLIRAVDASDTTDR